MLFRSIGRRTLFRHFDSRDALVAEALSSALDWYDERISRSNPADRPLTDWIADLALLNMEVQIDAGRGLWQLAATPDHELAPELAKVNVRRRKNRRASTVSIARAIWERAGGHGSCPQVIVDATAIAMSSFTTRSMTEDFGRDVTSVAQSIGTMLAALVASEAKRPAPAPRASRSSTSILPEGQRTLIRLTSSRPPLASFAVSSCQFRPMFRGWRFAS